MTEIVITTKDCTRCNGSGSYSFNLRDGTRCYGCGGTGKVACAPKGQKKIKPDCTDINKAQIGQTVLHACVLYRVEGIRETGKTFIHTPEHLVDTDYIPTQYDESNKVTSVIPQEEIEAYKQREAMWK